MPKLNHTLRKSLVLKSQSDLAKLEDVLAVKILIGIRRGNSNEFYF